MRLVKENRYLGGRLLNLCQHVEAFHEICRVQIFVFNDWHALWIDKVFIAMSGSICG